MFKQHLRSATPAQALSSTSLVEAIKETGATDARIVTPKVTGKKSLHLVTPTGEYLSVRISDKLNMTGDLAQDMKTIFGGNNRLFYGVSDGGNQWFTVAPEGVLVETAKIPLAQFLSAGAAALAKA